MKKITLLLYLFLTVITLDLNAQVAIGSGSTTNQAVPVEAYYGYSYSQSIFLQTEIAGAGDITELTFDFAGSSISNSNDWTIYIGHTTKTDFTSTVDWVDVTTLTQVHSGIVSLNGSSQVVVDITDFTYNNSDNLVIAVDENASGYNGASDDFLCFITGSDNRSITYYNDGTNPDPSAPPTGYLRNVAPNIILGGITTSLMAPLCAENPTPNIAATGVVVTGGAVTLAWDAPSTGDAPTSYEIFWGTTSGNLNSIGAIADTTANINNVDFATEYFWSIVPSNAGGSATGCAEWSFITEDAPPPPANDTLAGATPIVPSVAGTGCSTFTFANSTGGDGTTDSGLDGTCNTTDTGLDRFYSWTATSIGLIWNDGASNPGIVIRDASGTEITCAGTYAGEDTLLEGWAINDDLIIQVYDYGTADQEVTFCLEEYIPPAPIEPPYLNDFSTFPGTDWSQAGSGQIVDGPSGTSSDWAATNFANDAAHANGSGAKMNLYSNVDQEWLISPEFDLSGSATFFLNLDVAVTGWNTSGASAMGSDDEVHVLISIDSGGSWTSVTSFDASNQPGNTREAASEVDISAYAGEIARFAIWATDGSTDDAEDIDFHVDNFQVTASGLSVEDNVIQGFSLYPNPVNDRLHLNALDNIEELSVYNLLGQEVLRTQPKVSNTEVDMSNLPTGMYVVKVKVGEQLGSYRIVKK